jgi:penicillin-binding protein 1A
MGLFEPERVEAGWRLERRRRRRLYGRLERRFGTAVPFRYRLYYLLPWRTRLVLSTTCYVALLGGGGLAAGFFYYSLLFPDPLSLRHRERAPVVRILARDGAVLNEHETAHDYVPLEMIPQHVVDAVLATEDRRFYDHWGLDPRGLLRAAFANLRAGRCIQGGSTLTQQLAKNLFLSSERTLWRKAEEILLAWWLELRLSKTEILELYLNRVYFGAGAYGIEPAAQRYFDKSVRELSLLEAALLAGLLKAPSKFSRFANPEAARARARAIVSKMASAGFISAAAEQRAGEDALEYAAAKPSREATGLEYAIDTVLERLPPFGGASAEIIVETTIDATLQQHAQGIAQNALRQGDPATQAAIVVLDSDGAIRALVGGRSYQESQFNRATKARRQPGSAFKPFVYLAALEQGATPDTVGYDLPVTVAGWSPRNDSGRHRGAMTLREALANSVNAVAVRLFLSVGAERVIDVARRLGIRSELHATPALALGTSEVTPLELTGAYAVFANGGHAVEPYVIRQVRTSSGRVLYARPASGDRRVVAPAQVSAITDMLASTLANGTGRNAALSHHPAAGKTGTTQEFRDAWFVGFTSHLAAGVWVGSDVGQPTNRIKGSGLPARIWREVMSYAHERLEPRPLFGAER